MAKGGKHSPEAARPSALAEEAAGTAIIVYVDESFIYAHHAHTMGWFHVSDRDVIGDGDGKRLIILHAMTENGLLTVPDAVASNWLNEPAFTAELVFEEVLVFRVHRSGSAEGSRACQRAQHSACGAKVPGELDLDEHSLTMALQPYELKQMKPLTTEKFITKILEITWEPVSAS